MCQSVTECGRSEMKRRVHMFVGGSVDVFLDSCVVSFLLFLPLSFYANVAAVFHTFSWNLGQKRGIGIIKRMEMEIEKEKRQESNGHQWLQLRRPCFCMTWVWILSGAFQGAFCLKIPESELILSLSLNAQRSRHWSETHTRSNVSIDLCDHWKQYGDAGVFSVHTPPWVPSDMMQPPPQPQENVSEDGEDWMMRFVAVPGQQ